MVGISVISVKFNLHPKRISYFGCTSLLRSCCGNVNKLLKQAKHEVFVEAMAEALGSQHGSNESRSRKSKRNKKSFLQRAKKFGKRGRFGGDDLDKDTYDYFVRVLESLNKGDFEDAEAEGTLV